MKGKYKGLLVFLFTVGCIVLNFAGKLFAEALSLPVWLDSVGTIAAAYFCGPVFGAIVGASVNLTALFSEPTRCVYALASVAVGVTVGVCAQKNMFRDLFRAMTVSFLTAVISTTLSTPLNCLFFDGYTGNLWGDGVIELLLSQGVYPYICFAVGEFYIDFLDKAVLLCLAYALAKRWRRRLRQNKTDTSSKTTLCLLVAGALCLGTGVRANADDTGAAVDYSVYVQTIYNNQNGLTSGSATDLAQTDDGVLWVGTYNGLYRCNGSSFEWIDDFDSVKTVNCLYSDENDRLWIGTNDSGLSVYKDGGIIAVLDSGDGLPADAIRCIAGSDETGYYVGTTDSLAVVSLTDELAIVKVLPEISYAESISVYDDGTTAVVTDGGELFLLKGTDILYSAHSDSDSVFSCCAFDETGALYVGTTGSDVYVYGTTGTGLSPVKTVTCTGLTSIQELNAAEQQIFVCADNGAGQITESGFSAIDTNTFNSSIDHSLVDYQGNLWLTSSRLGLLKLCRAVFVGVYEKLGLTGQVVNAVTAWNGALYFGTDSGLDMADAALTAAAESELTESLDGVRIRNLTVDSENRLWIATSGSGVWCAESDGTVTVYGSENGALGDKFRMVLEKSDGTILLAGDAGITYIKDGAVSQTIGTADGLENPKVLCLSEGENGEIYAGTDGNGIAVIENGEITREIKRADGLSSEVILRVCPEEDGGYFIVTGNGLCYMDADGSLRVLENFPHYNNYDVAERDGKLFVSGSAGIYVVDKQALLDGEELSYVLLDSKKGLTASLTPNAWTYRDAEDNLYLPTSAGVVSLNLADYDLSLRSYHLRIRSLVADGVSCTVEEGETIEIASGAKRVEILPEVINYSANDPQVSVYLEGIDTEPRVMCQSELTSVVYMNLPAGSYVLHLAVLDGKGDTLSENEYVIEKPRQFYEQPLFLVYFVSVFALIVVYIVWLVFRTQVQKTLDLQRRELEIAQKQVRMSNEAILTIARTVDAKDTSTSQHSLRVSQYAVMIASHLGYDQKALEELRKTALLHDIGKVGIPDSILNKPARLTAEEYDIMKSHVVKGAEILKNFTSVDHVVEGALYHHERYDGRGYVHGLKGEEIPLNARIIGLADAFDAMTANRVYRKKLPMDRVIQELRDGRGTQFDPALDDILLGMIESGEIDIEKIFEENNRLLS